MAKWDDNERRIIRAFVAESRGWKCGLCGRRNLAIEQHHSEKEHYANPHYDELLLCCSFCHAWHTWGEQCRAAFMIWREQTLGISPTSRVDVEKHIKPFMREHFLLLDIGLCDDALAGPLFEHSAKRRAA
jgi:hypothetical protein